MSIQFIKVGDRVINAAHIITINLAGIHYITFDGQSSKQDCVIIGTSETSDNYSIDRYFYAENAENLRAFFSGQKDFPNTCIGGNMYLMTIDDHLIEFDELKARWKKEQAADENQD